MEKHIMDEFQIKKKTEMIKLEKFSFFNKADKDYQFILKQLDECFGKQYTHILKYMPQIVN